MVFPIPLEIQREGIDSKPFNINLYSGLTIVVGPNGSGKTQLLRGCQARLNAINPRPRKVRILVAGRSSEVDRFRSNWDGQRGLNYDGAVFGGKGISAQRHLSEGMTGDFHTLADRPDIQLKVTERLRKLFKRDLFIEWDGGNLKVFFGRENNRYSSAREASGLLQLVTMLSALYDDEVGALLIDEPEVSLHPQLQAFMFSEIQKYAGDPFKDRSKKIIILATHSPQMIEIKNPQDISNIIFCHGSDYSVSQIDPSMPELRNRKLQEFLIGMSQENKLGFFCSRPLLVEGPSDTIILNSLNKELELDAEAAGVQIIPLIGKGRIETVSKFMRLIGKNPIVMADADTLIDNISTVTNLYTSDPDAMAIASKHGHPDIHTFAKGVYTDFCDLVDKSWDDIALYAQKTLYWTTVKEEDETKKKRRAAFVSLLALDDLNTIPNNAKWTTIRTRLNTLLDTLEQCGCFVLRKGTIEGYYRSDLNVDNRGKLELALEEVSKWEDVNPGVIEADYADLIRTLKYSAAREEISETKAIEEILLAIAAPALTQLQDNPNITSEDLNSRARGMIQEKSSLFELKIEKDPHGEPILEIELKSNILDRSGFPIKLYKGCNVNSEIRRQLNL